MKPLRIPVCPSPGDCPGYYLPSTQSVPPEHPRAYSLIPCACTLARQAAKLKAELPATLQRMTFETYQKTEGNRKALTFARQFAAAPWEQTHCLLTFIGPNRVGKTHLAAAIVNELLERGEPALFENVPALLDYLRAGYDDQANDGFEARVARIKNAAVLVLDDLGAEAGHSTRFEVSWAQDKLYQIVDCRLVEEMPTIFTTNLVPNLLPSRISSRLWDARCGSVIAVQ